MTAMTPGHRDSMLPLIISVLVAVLLHAAIVPTLTVYGWANGTLRELSRLAAALPEELPPDDPRLGRDEGRASSVAWIAYDDFHELMARRSETEQPALQQTADPIAQAPPELDATPPAPQAAAPPRLPLLPPPSPQAGHPWRLDAVGDTRVAFAATPLLPHTAPPQQPQTTPQPAQAAAESRPTAAARSDRESPPTLRLSETVVYRNGRVETPQGIEIAPVVPRYSLTARYTMPRHPLVVLQFNGSGRVTQVSLVESSGFETVDGPIINACYQWRASGKHIEALGTAQTLEVAIRVIP